MILEQIRHLHIKCHDNVLQFAPINFDASIYEIWIALSSGATISMTSQENLTNMAFLTDFIERRNITTLVLPPSFLKLFDKAVLPSVNNIISAGEAVSFSDANFYRNFKKFTNAYGPTEASVCVTLCNDSKYFYTDPIPIGRPIANMKVYVLDQNMQVQPIGVPGEIYISGVGIARGYLNQPERTADSFVKNPYYESSLMYKTGDVGVWLPNGQLDFQGRVDDQIKLNGFRIELSEIVYVLKQHKIVEDVVVYFIAEQISAFVILAKSFDMSDKGDLSSRLRDFLLAYLPANSIPSTFVFVNEFPLMFNGKIDKQQLVLLATEQKRLLQRDTMTLREEEIEMSKLWKQILGIENIQADDNFFQIGGNSLRGIQLVSQVAKTMSMEMDLVDVFNYPTIRSLTSFLDKQVSFENDSFQAVEETDHYPLSYSQQSLWLTYKLNQSATNYNITVSFIIEGEVDRESLSLAYENLLKRHEILRTIFIEVQGEPRQKILESVQNGLVILEENDVLSVSSAKSYIESFMNEAFILDNAPPIKANLIVFQNGKSLFNLSLHHIIADGESTKIIINELADAYMHKPLNIPADNYLEVNFKDFAVWERNNISLGIHPPSKQYWMDMLTPAPRHRSLLTDFSRSRDYSFQGKTVSYIVPENVAEGIFNLAEKAETTPFTVLLTLIHILLRKETQEADVLTGIPFSNRQHPKLRNQIGYLSNTLLVRSSLNIDDSLTGCIDALKERLLEVFKHATYPFELVVENTDFSREIGRNALFDVFVSYNEDISVDIEQEQNPDFKVVPFDIDSSISAFDIAFNFTCISRSIKLDIQYNNCLFLEDSVHIIYLKFLAVCDPVNIDVKLSELDLDLDIIDDNARNINEELNLVIKNKSL
ncbi:Tyrocidine synthase 3 [compost metagenome]